MKRTISTEAQFQTLLGDLRSAWKDSGYLRVSVSSEKDRSAQQNSLSHVWYEQISRELGEDSPRGVKRYCKLHFGVPILRADDAEFCALYDAVVKPLPYEKKLQAMDLLPVTSTMVVGQLTRYLETMQREYALRGVQLMFPSDY